MHAESALTGLILSSLRLNEPIILIIRLTKDRLMSRMFVIFSSLGEPNNSCNRLTGVFR